MPLSFSAASLDQDLLGIGVFRAARAHRRARPGRATAVSSSRQRSDDDQEVAHHDTTNAQVSGLGVLGGATCRPYSHSHCPAHLQMCRSAPRRQRSDAVKLDRKRPWSPSGQAQQRGDRQHRPRVPRRDHYDRPGEGTRTQPQQCQATRSRIRVPRPAMRRARLSVVVPIVVSVMRA